MNTRWQRLAQAQGRYVLRGVGQCGAEARVRKLLLVREGGGVRYTGGRKHGEQAKHGDPASSTGGLAHAPVIGNKEATREGAPYPR